MDLFQLIIRLMAFALTFYVLLEFCVVCAEPTWKAILYVFFTMAIVIVIFLGYERYNVTICESCGQHIPATIKNGSIRAV